MTIQCKPRTHEEYPPWFLYPLPELIDFYCRYENEAQKRHGPIGVLAARRALATIDLFYLLVFVLRRKDAMRQWILDRCREYQENPYEMLDLWAREHYKMLCLSEPIPTPEGWTTQGALKVGDRVFGGDGQIIKVIALNDIVYDGEAYEIEFDDGFKIKAGAEHLWPVMEKSRKRIRGTKNKRLGRESKIMRTEDIFKHDHRDDNRLAVVVGKPIDMPEAELPIDPYTLGAWLGDGTSENGTITGCDKEIFERISKHFDIGHDMTPKRTADYRTIYGLRKLLRKNNLIKNKHIPPSYLRASIHQRIELLRGLMDTDGHCNTRGTATFCTIKPELAYGIEELANTLSLKPHVRIHKQTVNEKPYPFFNVSFQAYDGDLCPFGIKRKIERSKKRLRPAKRFIVACRKIKPEPMRCIQVSSKDGIYLAGKAMVPTHNSTIITFASTLQEIINDPEITIGIFSHTRPIAKAFLRQIKNECEQNDQLPVLYPDVFWTTPRVESPKWSEDEGLVFKRKGNPKESTIEAWGLTDGAPTSKHFDILHYDDVVTKESVNTPEQILKTTSAWQDSISLGKEGGKRKYVGTRWHLFDTYSEIKKCGVATERVRAATADGTEKTLDQPVLMSPDEIKNRRKMQGPYVFAAQYCLDPVADKVMGFRQEWIKFATVTSAQAKHLNIYLIVDGAYKQKKDSDFTSMWVIGAGADKNYYVLDHIFDRLNLTQRWEALYHLHQKWRPRKVGYEEFSSNADREHFEFMMSETNYRFEITPLAGSLSKPDRIRRLVPIYEQGRMYLPNTLVRNNYQGFPVDVIEVFIREEYTSFPVCSHYDQFDSLSRILDDEMEVQWPDPNDIIVVDGYDYHAMEEQNVEAEADTSWLVR